MEFYHPPGSLMTVSKVKQDWGKTSKWFLGRRGVGGGAGGGSPTLLQPLCSTGKKITILFPF